MTQNRIIIDNVDILNGLLSTRMVVVRKALICCRKENESRNDFQERSFKNHKYG